MKSLAFLELLFLTILSCFFFKFIEELMTTSKTWNDLNVANQYGGET